MNELPADEMSGWMCPQNWVRDRDEPCLPLGEEGAFDDAHIFASCVMREDGRYLMWYGSYSNQPGEEMRTALGFAVSADGLHWHKNPANPVFRPHPSHAWESHYTTSQSILRMPDGTWRMWYAARPKPPFRHKYYAIGTAGWKPREGPFAS
jgi:predicted GH43/DUF377 family glycosyl hydrolase